MVCEVLPSMHDLGIDWERKSWSVGPVEQAEIFRTVLVFLALLLTKVAFSVVPQLTFTQGKGCGPAGVALNRTDLFS